MASSVGARSSQAAPLVVYAGTPAAEAIKASQDALLAVYGPPEAIYTDAGQAAALVVYATSPNLVPDSSQVAALVVYAVGPPGAEARTRAWTYDLDGHTFYVLDLGEEGTFAYDMDTGEWARVQTDGFTGWNFRIGLSWGENGRIVGGDTLYGQTWELDPNLFTDEGFRSVQHLATGGVMTRSRIYLGVEAVRVSGSIGANLEAGVIVMNLRWSDDNGNTWSDYYTVSMTGGDFGGEVAYRSLGSFAAPGRIFEFSDSGGLKRIDGADVFIENFDGEDDGQSQ